MTDESQTTPLTVEELISRSARIVAVPNATLWNALRYLAANVARCPEMVESAAAAMYESEIGIYGDKPDGSWEDIGPEHQEAYRNSIMAGLQAALERMARG